MVKASGSSLMDLPGVGPDRRRPGPGRRRGRGPVRRPEPVRVLDRHRPDRGLLRRDRPAPALPGREPADEPHDPHRRDHPDPPEHPRPGLLPAQARRRQDQGRGDALPQAQDLRRPVPAADRRRQSRRRRRQLRRAREGTAGRHMNPARPARTRTPALRISHFPDPHKRRYPRRPRRGRPTPSSTSNPPLDDRGVPDRRTVSGLAGRADGSVSGGVPRPGRLEDIDGQDGGGVAVMMWRHVDPRVFIGGGSSSIRSRSPAKSRGHPHRPRPPSGSGGCQLGLAYAATPVSMSTQGSSPTVHAS